MFIPLLWASNTVSSRHNTRSADKMAATHRSSCLWLLVVAVVAGGSFLAVLHRAVGLDLGMNIDPTNPDGDPKPSLLTLGSGAALL